VLQFIKSVAGITYTYIIKVYRDTNNNIIDATRIILCVWCIYLYEYYIIMMKKKTSEANRSRDDRGDDYLRRNPLTYLTGDDDPRRSSRRCPCTVVHIYIYTRERSRRRVFGGGPLILFPPARFAYNVTPPLQLFKDLYCA